MTVRHGQFAIEKGYDPRVRVPEVLLKSVGFIGEVTHVDSAGPSGDLHATGFFVGVNSPEFPAQRYLYFVTAKHVAAVLQDRVLYVLVNKRGGGVLALNAVGDRWWLHPNDPTADVVALQVADHPQADYVAVNTKDFVTQAELDNDTVGIGDEVFATGLFTEAPGLKRNLPIVRHGNVAMIPKNEQIQTELGYADVYLVEVRSIGGLSGSPVFVRPTLTLNATLQKDGRPTLLHGAGEMKLLGLMHGHWDIKESEMNVYRARPEKRS